MGKKLTLYLIDGTDNGPRTIEIGNWSGKAIHSPRVNLKDIIFRTEFDRPGIYILKSDPSEDFYNEKIYVGEAEIIGKRIKQHLQNSDKDFKECIAFISKDELLTKSHIKYLESRIIKLAIDAKNSEIENTVQPAIPFLSEADISDMEEFIRQIKIILPTAGYQFLTSSTLITAMKSDAIDSAGIHEKVFSLKNKNYSATMRVVSDGFKVLSGSECTIKLSNSISEGWIKLRNKLLHNNQLIESGNKYIFAEDVVFSSPSSASSIILGRQSSGPNEWIDETGQTYREYEIGKTDNIKDE